MAKLLVIDDDVTTCNLLDKFLSKHGYSVVTCTSFKKAAEQLDDINSFQLVLCDLRLDNGNGKDLLVKCRQLSPSVPVIIITAHNDLKTAVNMMKLGAYDYILKPLIPEEMLTTIENALAEKRETTEDSNGKEESHPGNEVFAPDSEYISGRSKDFQVIMEQMNLVAPTDYSVIIYGESGSGKEAIAQEIHKRSKRRNHPFVAIDCGALQKELSGSELFGHEKGAFTGAVSQKLGSFEQANKGTLFLDEISNLSYDIQTSLLRVIQERKMHRVGGTTDIQLDVRIIVASNVELWTSSQRGDFREDLFHRLNEFTIKIPPLRERKEDIMLFADYFLEKTNKTLHKQLKGFSDDVERVFKFYPWYGNLRELKNVVKRAALLADGDYIETRFLPFEITNFEKMHVEDHQEETGTVYELPMSEATFTDETLSATTLKGAMIDMEYKLILKTLAKCNFNKSKAAKMLKIDRRTLYNKMNLYKEQNQKD